MNTIELSERDIAIIKDVLRVNKDAVDGTRSFYWEEEDAAEIGLVLEKIEGQVEDEQ